MGGMQTPNIAQLKTIGLDGLRNNSSEEKKKLFSAAKEDGIFYLNIAACEQELHDAVARLGSLSRALFSLPYEEKMRFDIDTISQLKLNGCGFLYSYLPSLSLFFFLRFFLLTALDGVSRYKPIGRNIGGHDGKERDGFETYAIPRNSIFSLTEDPFPRPSIIDEYTEALKIFTLGCMDVSNTIFSVLSETLGLPREKSLESFHNPSLPSPDILRLLRYAPSPSGNSPQVPLTPHTDLGSLTFLFAASPGLQILPDGSDAWLNVMPKPGHIIVNFGDALSILTGGLFRSILHRVASAPGSPMKERYSLAFLMRPENSTPMRSVPSPLIKADTTVDGGDEVLTSEGWLGTKFGVLRGSMDSTVDQAILTGGRVI